MFKDGRFLMYIIYLFTLSKHWENDDQSRDKTSIFPTLWAPAQVEL